MPGVDGLELASAIRCRPEFRGVPIVFVSAEDDAARHREALDAGGDDFLRKPVSIEILIETVARHAGKATRGSRR
jgi:CheY-like chemotaxis protein